MRRLAFGHIAANVMRRAEFTAANLGHGVPYLWFEPDACPMSVHADITNHKRAAFVRTWIFVRSEESAGKGRNHGSHPWMRCRARFTTVGSTTINSGLLISGLRAHTAVILAQNLARFFCEPYADTRGRFPADRARLRKPSAKGTKNGRRHADLRSPKTSPIFPRQPACAADLRRQGSAMNAPTTRALDRCESDEEESSLS